MAWLPDSSMFFDCACLVTERLRSEPAKATIRAIARVTMVSSVPRGEVRNIVSPSGRKPACLDDHREPFGCILLLKVWNAIMHFSACPEPNNSDNLPRF